MFLIQIATFPSGVRNSEGPLTVVLFFSLRKSLWHVSSNLLPSTRQSTFPQSLGPLRATNQMPQSIPVFTDWEPVTTTCWTSLCPAPVAPPSRGWTFGITIAPTMCFCTITLSAWTTMISSLVPISQPYHSKAIW